jgi:hypothetical protein
MQVRVVNPPRPVVWSRGACRRTRPARWRRHSWQVPGQVEAFCSADGACGLTLSHCRPDRIGQVPQSRRAEPANKPRTVMRLHERVTSGILTHTREEATANNNGPSGAHKTCARSEAYKPLNRKKRARSGTRTAFPPLQTLGTPENTRNSAQTGPSSTRSRAQGVPNCAHLLSAFPAGNLSPSDPASA